MPAPSCYFSLSHGPLSYQGGGFSPLCFHQCSVTTSVAGTHSPPTKAAILHPPVAAGSTRVHMRVCVPTGVPPVLKNPVSLRFASQWQAITVREMVQTFGSCTYWSVQECADGYLLTTVSRCSLLLVKGQGELEELHSPAHCPIPLCCHQYPPLAMDLQLHLASSDPSHSCSHASD
jgi:hypothetical protein